MTTTRTLLPFLEAHLKNLSMALRKLRKELSQVSSTELSNNNIVTTSSVQDVSRSDATLSTHTKVAQPNMAATVSYHEESDFMFPYVDYDGESNVRSYLNNSKVISDDSGYVIQPYTPLTAPELDLVNVVRGHNMSHDNDVLYFYSNHTEDLSWLIPAIIVVTFVLCILVCVSFYGFKKLRMKAIMFYFTLRRCCETKGQSSQEETDSLTSSMPQQQLEMGDYHTNDEAYEYDRFIL